MIATPASPINQTAEPGFGGGGEPEGGGAGESDIPFS